MKTRILSAVAAAACVTIGTGVNFGISAEEEKSKPVYSVSEYDPKRDAFKDLEETKKIAQQDGRRILLVVGGDWCPWCRLISKYFEANPAVAEILASGYVIMKVNGSDEQPNEKFLSNYPDFRAYPHLYILESDGTLLHSQDTEKLEKGRGYDENSFAGVLRKWAPKS